MKKLLFSVCCGMLLFSSCQNQDVNSNIPEENRVSMIDTQLISHFGTRSEIDTNEFSRGYLCTSETSSLRLEVYPRENNMESYSYIVDKDGNASYLLKFRIDSFVSDGICNFTALNEFDEPIMSGVYDTVGCQIKITEVYGNDAVSRASAAAWGCGLAMGIAGGIWSTAAGMVSAGVGFVVGLSYTAAAIAVCDGL